MPNSLPAVAETENSTATNVSVESLMNKLQQVADSNTEQPLGEKPEAAIDEQNLIVYNSENKRFFAGFRVDGTAKWTKEVFKSYLFPFPNQFNIELKMCLRILVNSGVKLENLHNFVFEHCVTAVSVDIGDIGNLPSKKTDLDSINKV